MDAVPLWATPAKLREQELFLLKHVKGVQPDDASNLAVVCSFLSHLRRATPTCSEGNVYQLLARAGNSQSATTMCDPDIALEGPIVDQDENHYVVTYTFPKEVKGHTNPPPAYAHADDVRRTLDLNQLLPSEAITSVSLQADDIGVCIVVTVLMADYCFRLPFADPESPSPQTPTPPRASGGKAPRQRRSPRRPDAEPAQEGRISLDKSPLAALCLQYTRGLASMKKHVDATFANEINKHDCASVSAVATALLHCLAGHTLNDFCSICERNPADDTDDPVVAVHTMMAHKIRIDVVRSDMAHEVIAIVPGALLTWEHIVAINTVAKPHGGLLWLRVNAVKPQTESRHSANNDTLFVDITQLRRGTEEPEKLQATISIGVPKAQYCLPSFVEHPGPAPGPNCHGFVPCVRCLACMDGVFVSRQAQAYFASVNDALVRVERRAAPTHPLVSVLGASDKYGKAHLV